MTVVCRNAAFVSLTQLALVNLLNSVVFHVSACSNYLLLRIGHLTAKKSEDRRQRAPQRVRRGAPVCNYAIGDSLSLPPIPHQKKSGELWIRI